MVLVSLNRTCSHWIPLGFTCPHLVSLGFTWIQLVSLGLVLLGLTSFDLVSLDLFGLTLSQLLALFTAGKLSDRDSIVSRAHTASRRMAYHSREKSLLPARGTPLSREKSLLAACGTPRSRKKSLLPAGGTPHLVKLHVMIYVATLWEQKRRLQGFQGGLKILTSM